MGDYYLDRINVADVTAWRDLRAKSFQPRTVNSRLSVFRNVLKHAQQQYGLHVNAATGVPALHVPQNVRDDQSKCMTFHETRRFLEAIRNDHPQWYPMVLTLALTGMRFGACTALMWEDIDFDRGVITVRRAHYRGAVAETKTGIVREIPLPPALADVLREHRRAQIQGQAPGLSEGWVFPSNKGTLRGTGVLTKPFESARRTARIGRKVSAHTLRHTVSNMLLQRGGEQVQRAIIGHSDAAMTLHYSHVTLEERATVLDQVVTLVVPVDS